MIDLNILIPGYLTDCNMLSTYNKELKENEFILRNMEKVSHQEFYGEFADYLNRYSLPDIYLLEKYDNGERTAAKPIRTKIIVTNYKNIVSINLFIFNIDWDITNLLDQISSQNVSILENNVELNLLDYLKNKYNITSSLPMTKCLITADIKEKRFETDNEYKIFLLAGEAYKSKTKSKKIISEKYHQRCAENIAEYDFADIFVSEKNVLYKLKENLTGYKERFSSTSL